MGIMLGTTNDAIPGGGGLACTHKVIALQFQLTTSSTRSGQAFTKFVCTVKREVIGGRILFFALIHCVRLCFIVLPDRAMETPLLKKKDGTDDIISDFSWLCQQQPDMLGWVLHLYAPWKLFTSVVNNVGSGNFLFDNVAVGNSSYQTNYIAFSVLNKWGGKKQKKQKTVTVKRRTLKWKMNKEWLNVTAVWVCCISYL